MSEDDLTRIQVLTDLMSNNVITACELVELENLQEQWLLYSDIAPKNNGELKRAFRK